MSNTLLEIQNLRKAYGALAVTDGVSLTVESGEIHGLIGPNGAGKTTLVSQISGLLSPDEGRISFQGNDITQATPPVRTRMGLGRSFQITSVFKSMTALENIALAVRAKQGHCFQFWRAANRQNETQDKAAEIISTVGLAGLENTPCDEMGHGELRQLELGIALAANPKLLILDEPMAGLSPAESRQMVDLLAVLKKDYGILLIEHDMDAVFTLADRISVLVAGKVVFTGSAEDVRNSELVQRAYLGDDDDQ